MNEWTDDRERMKKHNLIKTNRNRKKSTAQHSTANQLTNKQFNNWLSIFGSKLQTIVSFLLLSFFFSDFGGTNEEEWTASGEKKKTNHKNRVVQFDVGILRLNHFSTRNFCRFHFHFGFVLFWFRFLCVAFCCFRVCVRYFCRVFSSAVSLSLSFTYLLTINNSVHLIRRFRFVIFRSLDFIFNSFLSLFFRFVFNFLVIYLVSVAESRHYYGAIRFDSIRSFLLAFCLSSLFIFFIFLIRLARDV